MENPFKKPYTVTETPKGKIVFVLVFGAFIFLFLFLFAPFGMSQLETKSRFFVSLGFGLITIFMLFIFKFLIEPVLHISNRTIGGSIFWGLVIASSIGTANFFYMGIIFHQDFNIIYLLLSVWTAILVGIIPSTIGYILSFNKIYKTALLENAISPDEVLWESEVTIRGGNPKNEFKINPKNIVYLCSNDNYITIITIKGETLTKTHLRGTLKEAETELKKNSSFFRCHKCFIVNSEYADHVTGNVQNLKIKLKTQDLEIPVSRSKAAEAIMKFR